MEDLTYRQIAEKKIGRKLKEGEVVHHIDKNRRNNQPENLMVLRSEADHNRIHKIYGAIVYLNTDNSCSVISKFEMEEAKKYMKKVRKQEAEDFEIWKEISKGLND